MKFAFDEDQEMFRDMIRGALQREAGLDKVRRWTDAADLSPFDAFVARNGWLGIGIAEELGGQGGGVIEQAILFEELGRSAVPTGHLLAGSGGVLGFAKRVAGGLDAVGMLLTGEGVGVLVVPAGQPIDRANTHVKQSGGRLSGTIPLVLNAPSASHLLVPVADSEGFDLWLVLVTADGVKVQPRALIDRSRQFGDVTLNDASAIHVGHLTQAAATDACAHLAVLLAAQSLGLARRMLEMTVEYVKQRVQFGVPVGSFQAVKHAAAETLVSIEAAHSGIYYAAWALANGEADAQLHAWISKAFVAEKAVATADCALQLHGAIGYTWEYDLQLLYKQAKVNLDLFGSSHSYQNRIADALALSGASDTNRVSRPLACA